jgi:hypothetical protein
MGRAKEIVIKVITKHIGDDFIKKHHYSGKVVNNSVLHFGCFLDNTLHGVLQYGSPLDKSKVIQLVKETQWNDFLELNRMAFDDYLPRNSESYCIGKTLRLIKKNSPNIKWVISFADGCSCGDGTIYRASNFVLTGIKKNHNLCEIPSGEKIHKLTLESTPVKKRPELGGKSYFDITNGKYDFKKYVKACGGKIIEGYQLRYIYFIDKSYRKNLTVPEIPFSKIDEVGAGMYKGQRISIKERREKEVLNEFFQLTN